jgi:hypothetical protein
MIYHFQDKHSKAVYRGFIGGVMVSVLVLKAIDCGFIGGIMVSVLKYAKQYATDEPAIYHFRDKHVNHDTTNVPTIYCFQQKNVNRSSVA